MGERKLFLKGHDWSSIICFSVECSHVLGTVNASCRCPTWCSRRMILHTLKIASPHPHLHTKKEARSVSLCIWKALKGIYQNSFCIWSNYGAWWAPSSWEETPGAEGSEPLACSCRPRPQGEYKSWVQMQNNSILLLFVWLERVGAQQWPVGRFVGPASWWCSFTCV